MYIYIIYICWYTYFVQLRFSLEQNLKLFLSKSASLLILFTASKHTLLQLCIERVNENYGKCMYHSEPPSNPKTKRTQNSIAQKLTI